MSASAHACANGERCERVGAPSHRARRHGAGGASPGVRSHPRPVPSHGEPLAWSTAIGSNAIRLHAIYGPATLDRAQAIARLRSHGAINATRSASPVPR